MKIMPKHRLLTINAIIDEYKMLHYAKEEIILRKLISIKWKDTILSEVPNAKVIDLLLFNVG